MKILISEKIQVKNNHEEKTKILSLKFYCKNYEITS